MNLYETLGIEPEATSQEIKKAYKKLSMKLHPDRNPGDPDAEEEFKSLKKSYEVLSDPVKRKRYDETGTIEADGKQNLRDQAIQMVTQLMLSAMRNSSYDHKNYLKPIKNSLKSNLSAATHELKNVGRHIASTKKIIADTQSDSEVLTGSLKNTLLEMKAQESAIEEQIKILGLAVDFVENNCKWTGEEIEPTIRMPSAREIDAATFFQPFR